MEPINLMTINDLRLESMIYGRREGEFHGKDNTANLSQGSEMRIPDICVGYYGHSLFRLNAKSAYLTFLEVFLRYFWVSTKTTYCWAVFSASNP